jgi:hypothetical protein
MDNHGQLHSVHAKPLSLYDLHSMVYSSLVHSSLPTEHLRLAINLCRRISPF